MRFDAIADSLFERGFAIKVVCGKNYSHSRIPARLARRKSVQPCAAAAAIDATKRGRLISYIERGLVPSCQFRNHDLLADQTDDAAVHLILHRGNALYGAIRGVFHPFHQLDRERLFCMNILRSCASPGAGETLMRAVRERELTSSHFFEVSGWFANPDMRVEGSAGLILPAAVCSFTSLFDRPFSGFSSSRASNGAARILIRMGGGTIPGLKFHDPDYRGEVQLMTLHSHDYRQFIDGLVEALRNHLVANGIVMAAGQQPQASLSVLSRRHSGAAESPMPLTQAAS